MHDSKVAGRIGPADPHSFGRFLEDADRIGRRLVSDAQWAGERCTWTVRTPDRSAGRGVRRTVEAPAGPAMYQGAAGIALFLAELYRLTGEEECRRAAAGGMRHALADAQRMLPWLLGFHSGRVGVAYAAARAAECLDAPELLDGAWEILNGVFGHEREDRGLDVIAGSAGALVALLALAGGALSERREALLASAERMGEHLIAVAHVEPVGWSWGTIRSGMCAQNLTGYAHGASGVAHALAELYRVSGRSKYRYAARQGFRYERRWYDPDRGNWPDFRHTELGEWLLDGGTEELATYLRSGGRIEPYEPKYMTAWCHGAPGIGLARLRGWRILGDAELRSEAEAAVRTTAASLAWQGQGHSLCHGGFGNAETLLVAADVLGKEEWRDQVGAFADAACAGHERAGRPWRSGTMGALPDPSLLLGDAGVGHLLLRLHDPSVASVLCLDADGLPAAEACGEEEAERLREASAEHFFGASRRAFRRLGALPDVDGGTGSDGRPRSDAWDAAGAYEALAVAIEREADGGRQPLLEAAFRIDRVRYERARDAHDPIGTFLDGLVRDDVDAVAWEAGRFALAPGAVVVEGLALARDGVAEEPAADDSEHHHAAALEPARAVIFDTPAGVQARALGPFAAAVLTAAQRPASVEEISASVAEAFDPPAAPELLRPRVVEQLAVAYKAGIISIVRPEHSGRAVAGIDRADRGTARTTGSVG